MAGRPVGTKKNGFKYLDEPQLSRFFQAVKKGKNFQHELWFDLCFYFGLRVTELTHLRLSDITISSPVMKYRFFGMALKI